MKIAFTVYNLAFVSNWIERLMPYWENCEIVIFHIANLQGQKEPAIEGVKSYDVSSRSYSEIIDIIEHERIDLWINFNFRSLFELFFQRICALQNIKSVYLEHGFFSKNTLHFKTQKAQKNIWETVNRQLNFWKKYIGVLYHAKKRLQEWRILQQVYFKNNFKYSPFDYYFIFSQREYSLLSNVFPLDESNTSLIGYPIFSSEKDKKEATSAGLKMNGEVLYVHQPFILDGYATISYEEEKKYFLDLEKQLLKKYKRLIVLLHPRENLSTYIKRFADTQIDIIQLPNNYSCFTDKSLIIGHYSTALLYALYFEKPTIILNYPSVKNDPIFQECFPTVEDMENICTIDFQIDINKKIPFAGKENTYEHIAHEILLKCGK